MTKKIIFLDIDGVLNHPGTFCESSPWRREVSDLLRVPIAPECMGRLNRLVAETDAQIVISSSWRLFAHWQDLGPALARYGLVGEVIGETPNLVNDAVWLEAWRMREGAPFTYERLERGWEIAEWLRLHPEVTSFVILDDGSDMAHLRHRLVLMNPVVGLDDPAVERARQLLMDASGGDPARGIVSTVPESPTGGPPAAASCAHSFLRYVLESCEKSRFQQDGVDDAGRPYRDLPMRPAAAYAYAATIGSDFQSRVVQVQCVDCGETIEDQG